MTQTTTDVSRLLPTDPALLALLEQHDWDALIFGGFLCLTCTPEEAYNEDPDLTVSWPCPPLRAAGMTNQHAEAVVLAHSAAIEAQARARYEQESGGTNR
jgi:hypothetical protein